MVFGQGTNADFAYDATVMYHEFTHGVVFAWGGFNPTTDSLGAQWEARALNEGTADAMAASESGRSQIGSFITAAGASPSSSPGPFLRDLSDPSASRTCQGDGTLVPGLIVVNGLDGEEHDDGEIWNGFYWEVYQGLKSAGIKACNGTCEAGPAIQYKALQLSANTSPTFNSYWQTFKTATSVMFPPASGAAAYVDCVAKRRKLDKCDRTVPLYAGEKKEEVVNFRYSPFQIVINATGQAQFSICSVAATATTIYARNGSAIQVDPATGTVTADASASFTHQCSAGVQTFTIGSAAGETWYLLLDLGSTAVADFYRIDMGTTGVSSRPAAAPIPTCAPPILTATPATASIAPRGTVAFTATGGSGSGYAWSLPTNASTGAIDASTGAYTAGPNGGVTDVVQVTDSLGNTAKASVSVSAPAPAPSPSPAPSPTPNPSPNSGGGGGGCSTSGAHGLLLSLAALASLLRRRAKRIR